MKKSFGPNTLLFTTPVWVVGTFDAEGEPNVMTAAWGGICCSKPPCVAVSLRKATYSYAGIVERKAFTINVPSEDQLQEADFFGMASGRDRDKFAESGLMPVKAAHVDAPYIEEFPLVAECRLIHTLEIGLHTQFVGEIVDIKADETILDARGRPDIERARPFVYDPASRSYHGLRGRVAEAFKVGKPLYDR